MLSMISSRHTSSVNTMKQGLSESAIEKRADEIGIPYSICVEPELRSGTGNRP